VRIFWLKDRPFAEIFLTCTTHNIDKRKFIPAEIEPATPASERPQTHALDCAATGIGCVKLYYDNIDFFDWSHKFSGQEIPR